MYERSAIVLERYFENLLGYRRECNLRDNFNYYCELVEKLEKYQTNYQKELIASQEYNVSLKKIKAIQLTQEKLYKNSANLEYNRYLLFSNVEAKIDDTRKCIEKIEQDVEKNNAAMVEQKEELLAALEVFNDKKFELSKCKRYKKMAENDYNEILEVATKNFEGITQEDVENAKKFAKFDDIDDIIETLTNNGSGEKIPFNEGVIQNATVFGVDIAKKEVLSYITIYDKMKKLLADISEGVAKIELHKKYLRNEKAKIDFILAVKEYIVQFLDYERMTVIHGRKSHNRLMSEACENFNTDIIQINNLFELLVREINKKATKKAYKELYNKSYLTEIKEKEEKFKKEKNRVNLNTATLINSNYWRIEGIKGIFTVFYKNVSEVFGRDVAEFDIPKDFDEEISDDVEQEEVTENVEQEEIVEEQPKIPFDLSGTFSDEDDEIEEDSYDEDENSEKVEAYDEEVEEGDSDEFEGFDEEIEDSTEEEFDIFGEKYQDIDFLEQPIVKAKIKTKKQNAMDEEDIPYEEEDEEETLFNTKTVKNDEEIEDFYPEREVKKVGKILKNIRKISGAKKKTDTTNIW
ncbi:MAG TPA: hypothetical protein IAD08_08565 [Candidatus Scatovivens faecipullorum]|nr:hypothetical protein [Candidatus Scatovivens faecipullorum]